ncbi:LPS-assembly lipoprotein LptE [Legionella fallonii]|uniref:LPS-assembly lipoprotein LptE n=1 Tax=Legionella fallonii LLAP-10 TaxID=1212491 RepID=A0A098G3Z1_9GAMM|nr:LPS assembly lipoprotein LptE [Legionella fallonii]CEG56699.1 Rare lipoprotein B [Legionella fallonii LLAP-10]
MFIKFFSKLSCSATALRCSVFGKSSVPLVLALLLSACGFHLRGLIDVPEWLNNVSIISKDGNKELISILKSQLEGYKIRVNPDPAFAKYWLIISNVNVHQQVVSIGASTNPRQYQLILTLVFTLQTSRGQVIKPPQYISVSRQLTVNSDRILGSNDEETILVNEMKKEAVLQIINRLSRK